MPGGVPLQTYSAAVDGPRCDYDTSQDAVNSQVGGVLSGFSNPNLARHYLGAATINGPHDVQHQASRSSNNFI